MRKLLLSFLMTFIFSFSYAQKKRIAYEESIKWPSIESSSITNNGRYVKYIIYNDKDCAKKLIIQRSDTRIIKTIFNISTSEEAIFSEDSRYLFFKTDGDSLGIFQLDKNIIVYVKDISYYKVYQPKGFLWLEYGIKDHKDSSFFVDVISKKKIAFKGRTNTVMMKAGIFIESNNGKDTYLKFFDLKKRSFINIGSWKGIYIDNILFDGRSKVIFRVKGESTSKEHQFSEYWYYDEGFESAKILFNDSLLFVKYQLHTVNVTGFSVDSKRVYLDCSNDMRSSSSTSSPLVKIWRYNDKYLLSDRSSVTNQLYKATYNFDTREFVRLTGEFETYRQGGFKNDSIGIVVFNDAGKTETSQYGGKVPVFYLISSVTGTRIKLPRINPIVSPTGRFILYYDEARKAYVNYNIEDKTFKNITSSISTDWLLLGDDHVNSNSAPRGIVGWMNNDEFVLIYDKYDIWKVDPLGKYLPENLTKGYGRMNRIVFFLTFGDYENSYLPVLNNILLTAFNTNNKENGFFLMRNGKTPEKLTMSNKIYDGSHLRDIPGNCRVRPQRSFDESRSLVTICSSQGFPNIYCSSDFKTFQQLSYLRPESEFNWYTSTLLKWKAGENDSLMGVLYKPQNFDSTKRYPVIFHYYEKMSDRLNAYINPDYSGRGVNVPSFVSNGYMIFELDIQFKIGHPGESALNAVLSAYSVLSKLPYIDSTKVGLQGISFGGYITNYILTRSSKFAAACSQAAICDLVGDYLRIRDGHSNYSYYETGQGRIGSTLWDNLSNYLENSPVLHVDKVQTPVLIFHGTIDQGVPFAQGLEFYLGLRRLRKKSWLLEYKNGFHGVNGASAQDFTIRLSQFFDYYLKGEKPPNWLTDTSIEDDTVPNQFQYDYNNHTP